MELKKSISDKKVLPLYVFTGTEVAIMDIYINKIFDMYDGDVISADSLSSIVSRLKSNSLLTSKSCLYIIRDDKAVLSADKIWDSLKTGTFQNKNSIIFVFNNLDKRGKFFKAFSDYIVSFEPLSADILIKYVNKDLSISKDRALELISICQNNYNRLLLEIDKIQCLANFRNCSHNEAYDACISEHSFYIPPEGEVFDLLNAILMKDVANTYVQLQAFKERGDSALAVLSLLHTNLKAILQLQFAQGHSNIGQVTGLTGFQIKNASKFVDYYTSEELIRTIRICRFCEKSIKQTGMMDADMVLDFLFTRIF